MTDYIIRPYELKDREAVRKIAADTGFLGEPLEPLMEDRNLFNDIFMDAYLLEKSAIGFVAEVNGQVVGYIIGVDDTKKFSPIAVKQALKTLARAALGRYGIGTRTIAYALRIILGTLKGENVSADPDQYPAHLHIDLDSSARGLGIGSDLLRTYLDQLRSLGVKGVHLQTTSRNQAALKLYEKFGFKVLARHQATQYGRLVDGEIFNLALALEL